MSDQQTREALEERITIMSAECERGIVGDRSVNGVPIAAYARIAPNCLVYCQPLIPEREIFLDFCLN